MLNALETRTASTMTLPPTMGCLECDLPFIRRDSWDRATLRERAVLRAAKINVEASGGVCQPCVDLIDARASRMREEFIATYVPKEPSRFIEETADGLIDLFANLEPLGEWAERGVCGSTDPEAYHSLPGHGQSEAKRVCSTCPVRPECLRWALENPDLTTSGIWGGLDQKNLWKIRGEAKRSLAEQPVADDEVLVAA